MKIPPLVAHTAVLLVAASLLAACGQSSTTSITPREIAQDTYCALDGMLLAERCGVPSAASLRTRLEAPALAPAACVAKDRV